MTVFVTGGAGYIGSHTCVELLNAGYEVIVADNLSNSSKISIDRVERITGKTVKFYEIDLCDAAACDRVFAENPNISAVIHFAALKAVGESVTKPVEYYSNNLINTLNVLASMKKHKVFNFVFSSSATVYGDPETVPVRENFPTSATNPYGASKLFIERILADLCSTEPDFRVADLRYFNPIGAHESGLIGEDPRDIPNNLLPFVAQVAVGKLQKVSVFGNDYPTKDGTGVRDYIHVVDLAKGHLAALKKLETTGGFQVYNLGTGNGYSVLEVIEAFSRASGREIPYEIAPRRAGDIALVYADPSKAKNELLWEAEFGMDRMCADSWRWQRGNPEGYSEA